MDRARILIVTRNLPPLVGGMEQLNWHLADELSRSAEVHMIGPAGSAARAPRNVQVREAPLKPLARFLLSAAALARREARHWKPDWVLAGSGLTAPIALRAARACDARSAVYVHGLDVAAQHLLYRSFWLPAIRKLDRVIANSHATADLCRKIGVAPKRIGIVHPGVSLPEHPADATAADQFRSEQHLGTRPVLLSVGRLTERKGLREFVANSLPRIIAAQPETMLLIVGDAPAQALHAKAQSRESIQAVADAAGIGKNLRFFGVIIDRSRLAAIYSAADVHVFPVRSIPGDPEGFGMVAVEAAAHGLPTVAFATGGVLDAVADGRSGYLVAPGDYAALASSVLAALGAERPSPAQCMAFAQQFAWTEFGKQLDAQLSRAPLSRAGANHLA